MFNGCETLTTFNSNNYYYTLSFGKCSDAIIPTNYKDLYLSYLKAIDKIHPLHENNAEQKEGRSQSLLRQFVTSMFQVPTSPSEPPSTELYFSFTSLVL